MSIPTDLIGGQLKPVVCRNANRKRILREREIAGSTKDIKDKGGLRKVGTCPTSHPSDPDRTVWISREVIVDIMC